MSNIPVASVNCVHTEIWPLDKFVPNPRNPYEHPDVQVVLLSKIILAQGWRRPIVVSSRSGYVVKGHGRLKAAQAVHLATAPVEIQDYASARDEMADMIADNRMAELSDIDDNQLKVLLAEISADGSIGVFAAGFTDRAYAQLVGGETSRDSSATEKAKASATRASNRKLGTKILQYNLIFDDELQQQRWFALLKNLRQRYPNHATISERVFACVSGEAPAMTSTA